MNRILIFRIGKFIFNFIVLALLYIVISLGFQYRHFMTDWSKLKIIYSVICGFFPFVLLALAITTGVNFSIEKFIEKTNKKEFLKILVFHLVVTTILIVWYSYVFVI